MKQVRSQQNLGKQDFQFVAREVSELFTKVVTDTIEKLLRGSKSTTNAKRWVDWSNVNVKTFAFMSKNGILNACLVRNGVGFTVGGTWSQFRLFDDPDSDKWNGFNMIGRKLQ